MVLHDGAIAEMKTGEGKTLTATLAVFLNTLAGDSVHLVTVNDYLARRDAEWMAPIYDALGVSVAAIQEDDDHAARQRKYACDVTYGTNSEFGFDYLRDNMAVGARALRPARPQLRDRRRGRQHPDRRGADAADHLRRPRAGGADLLHLRPPRQADGRACRRTDKLRSLGESKDTSEADYDYEFDEKHKTVAPTERGVKRAEEFIGVDNLYLERARHASSTTSSRR